MPGIIRSNSDSELGLKSAMASAPTVVTETELLICVRLPPDAVTTTISKLSSGVAEAGGAVWAKTGAATLSAVAIASAETHVLKWVTFITFSPCNFWFRFSDLPVLIDTLYAMDCKASNAMDCIDGGLQQSFYFFVYLSIF